MAVTNRTADGREASIEALKESSQVLPYCQWGIPGNTLYAAVTETQ